MKTNQHAPDGDNAAAPTVGRPLTDRDRSAAGWYLEAGTGTPFEAGS